MAQLSIAVDTARVVVIGAGGLGCAVLPRIARMGIAHLTIIDGDRVEAANLGRQTIYEEVDIGHLKASTAAMWMRQILVGGEVTAHNVFLDAANARDLLQGHDMVVEGVDDLHAKTLIDRTCAELGIPLVSGGVHERQGQVIVLHAPGPHSGLGRADIFSGRPGPTQDGCDMRNVPLEVLEEVGRMMGQQVHDLLHGRNVVNGRIELLDGRTGNWTVIDPPRT
mgnify:CR=1 FL=1|jgi:molybdopterin/thiamine biosynthesis adenylyltransferase